MKKILLIEDNLRNATLITKILKPHGYEITHAIDATTGLWMAQQTWFDLVLLDMGLPDMHGTTAADCLQNIGFNRQMPIIAVTADTTSETMRQAIASGCQEVIHKPIDTRAFIDQVAKHLDTSAV